MTKFILHGGNTGAPSPRNQEFFKEIIKGLFEPVRILLVYYARPEAEWPILFEEDRQNFSQNTPEKELDLIMASKNKKELITQLQSVQVVYVRGGDTVVLFKQLRKVRNLAKLLDNKTYVGNSAGVYVLAKYYYSNDRNMIDEGLGILPIKAICHFDQSQHAQILHSLATHGEELPIVKIKEADFVIL